jgi:hypothetical protein
MIATGDVAQLRDLFAPEAVFRSPAAFSPYKGADTVVLILRTVAGVFEGFRYHREFVSGTQDVALEFSARIGDKELKGIDLIRFNENGLITDFEVMIRPASGLMALGDAMGKRIGPQLMATKNQ